MFADLKVRFSLFKSFIKPLLKLGAYIFIESESSSLQFMKLFTPQFILTTLVPQFFRFEQLATTYRTEVLAGVTTFMTMAYILVVNPRILSNAIFINQPGDLFNQLLTTTAISSAIAGRWRVRGVRIITGGRYRRSAKRRSRVVRSPMIGYIK